MNGRIPDDIKGFYATKLNDDALSPEEEAARKQAEAEEKLAQQRAKKDKKKDPKKKKGKKSKGDDDDEPLSKVKIGPTEVVTKFGEFYDEYNHDWLSRDESNNKD